MDASPESLAGSQDQCKTHRHPGRGRQVVSWAGGGRGLGRWGEGRWGLWGWGCGRGVR